jgi:16S rRNA (adenine1518-N6/adenine1519-N6)-dimethyltransferase
VADWGKLPPLREIIRQHGLAARKSLGQHFLLDLNLTRKIARAAGAIDQGTVIEIGPGPGGLTRALLVEGARKVIAVETDPRCLGALAEIAAAYPGRLVVIPGDALEIDVSELGDPPRQIVSNLPYNIGTALLLIWLRTPKAFASFTLMFQKEVANRLLARPGTKDYGRLTVLTQWLMHVKPLFDVPASAFTPPPKVTSTVVQLTPRAEPLYPADRASLEKITAAAFGQRRKMLRQSLKQVTFDPRAFLSAAGIQETARAEEIDIDGFCALARALKSSRDRPGAAG